MYVLNRDSQNNVTISSPLEAHKSQTVVLTTEGLDVGFDNPVFACLELNYADADEDPTGEAAAQTDKLLTFYQLDLGLNHVIRRWSEATERSANMLARVPGVEGPGGVLVMAENWVLYRNEGHPEVRAPLPRREHLPAGRGTLLVCCALFQQKVSEDGRSDVQDRFFYLVQSEYGDLYKITLDFNASHVHDLTVKYFDTIPTATTLHITKHGMLLATSEVGDQCVWRGVFTRSCFYQFVGLGEDDAAETSFSSFLAPDGSVQVPVFSPRALTNLKPLDVIPSLSPMLKLHAEDLRGDGAPQLYALCGRGSRSSLRVLQQGLSVATLSQNALPYAPRGLWTLRDARSGVDKYMVISFNNATIVLSVGETVEQVGDTGFKLDESTLLAGVLEGGSLLQVTPGGFRQIFEDGHTKIWEPPSRRSVVCAAMNARQIAVALSNGDVLYFELDERLEWVEQESMNHNEDVTCLDLPSLGKDSLRAPFLAVGYGDRSCRMYSLAPNGLLEELSVLALLKMPSALALETMHMGAAGHGTETLMLTVGTEEGVLMRVEVDDRTGKLGTERSSRFLGPRPVRLFKVLAGGLPCVLALSLKPWLCYCADNTMMLTPLVCDSLDFAASFASKQCAEGLVCVSGSTLEILRVENLSQPFASTSVPLSYTPRQLATVPGMSRLIILETEHNAYSELEKQTFYQRVGASYVNEYDCGAPIPETQDKWASCIRVVDATTLQTLERLELADNEAAFSICTCRFHDKGDESFVVIGTAKNLKIHPRSCSQGFISVFRFVEGRSLQLLHRTEVDEVPGALCEFDGRLAAGIGRSLRVYDLGKKKLLRKCENKVGDGSVLGRR